MKHRQRRCTFQEPTGARDSQGRPEYGPPCGTEMSTTFTTVRGPLPRPQLLYHCPVHDRIGGR